MTKEGFGHTQDSNKQERYALRGEIRKVLYDLDEVLRREGRSGVDYPDGLGEVHSKELISFAESIRDDENLWSDVPEEKIVKFTLHGTPYTKTYKREDIKNKLTELVSRHESVEIE